MFNTSFSSEQNKQVKEFQFRKVKCGISDAASTRVLSTWKMFWHLIMSGILECRCRLFLRRRGKISQFYIRQVYFEPLEMIVRSLVWHRIVERCMTRIIMWRKGIKRSFWSELESNLISKSLWKVCIEWSLWSKLKSRLIWRSLWKGPV